ncbi:MAG: succinylglutamate desuccinylase [Spirochaetaceae bacterium]|nr:succinylglutamate desuccinylase [Spirochaetaceae bacterium]
MSKNRIGSLVFLALALAAAATAGSSFLAMRAKDPIVSGPGVSEKKMLSDWFPGLKGGPGDTEVFVLRGSEGGGSMLVLGGTHANEPAGYLTAVLLVENARVGVGTLYVIPRANASAFTHNDPQEGSPQRLHFTIASGAQRVFAYGSRATNPVHQWPDPDVYIHASSGQRLSGNETRNLNRGYPGRADGTLTERVCYGITELIRAEKVTVTVDLHEASPEYPVNMALVAHPKAMGLASQTVMGLEMRDIAIRLEPSPVNLRGLTHRELGDFTDTMPVLMETPNASQGRLRGRTNEALAIGGVDPWYLRAQALGRLFVPWDEKGHPIEERVGRHLAGIEELALSLGFERPESPIALESIPAMEDLLAKGLGAFLLPAP